MSAVDLARLCSFADELSEAACDARRAEVEAAIRAACAELEAWRARFGFDRAEDFDIYSDREDGEISFWARPTAEELEAQRARAEERQLAIESRRRAPRWPAPPDPDEVIGHYTDGKPVTRAMLGEGSELMAMATRLRRAGP